MARALSLVLAFLFCASLVAGCPGPVTPPTDANFHFGPASGASCPTPAVTYAAFGQTFFATYCTRCHASTLVGAARAGAPEGYDFDTIAGVRAWRTAIDETAASGPSATNTTMPFAGTQPTLAERQQLGQLLACGVPD